MRTGLSSCKSPIVRALGSDFSKLRAAVRKHYSQPAVHLTGIMDWVHVNAAVRPIASLSYALLRAPVPHRGHDIEFTVHSCVDDSGTMHWTRRFLGNGSFPGNVTFSSQMVFSEDHRIIEFTRFGLGVESSVNVDGLGRLVYDFIKYVKRVPGLGLIVRIPTWLSPLGGGTTTETENDEDSFRAEFEMTHPIFGRTVGYAGTCSIR